MKRFFHGLRTGWRTGLQKLREKFARQGRAQAREMEAEAESKKLVGQRIANLESSLKTRHVEAEKAFIKAHNAREEIEQLATGNVFSAYSPDPYVRGVAEGVEPYKTHLTPMVVHVTLNEAYSQVAAGEMRIEEVPEFVFKEIGSQILDNVRQLNPGDFERRKQLIEENAAEIRKKGREYVERRMEAEKLKAEWEKLERNLEDLKKPKS